MADGTMFGRLLRVATSDTHKDGSVTAFLTVVKDRGSYIKGDGTRAQAKSDFLSFRKYIQAGEKGQNVLNYYKKLAEGHAWMNFTYSLKSDKLADGKTITYLRFDNILNNESASAVQDRLARKQAVNAEMTQKPEDVEEAPVSETTENIEFNDDDDNLDNDPMDSAFEIPELSSEDFPI